MIAPLALEVLAAKAAHPDTYVVEVAAGDLRELLEVYRMANRLDWRGLWIAVPVSAVLWLVILWLGGVL